MVGKELKWYLACLILEHAEYERRWNVYATTWVLQKEKHTQCGVRCFMCIHCVNIHMSHPPWWTPVLNTLLLLLCVDAKEVDQNARHTLAERKFMTCSGSSFRITRDLQLRPPKTFLFFLSILWQSLTSQFELLLCHLSVPGSFYLSSTPREVYAGRWLLVVERQFNKQFGTVFSWLLLLLR